MTSTVMDQQQQVSGNEAEQDIEFKLEKERLSKMITKMQSRWGNPNSEKKEKLAKFGYDPEFLPISSSIAIPSLATPLPSTSPSLNAAGYCYSREQKDYLHFSTIRDKRYHSDTTLPLFVACNYDANALHNAVRNDAKLNLKQEQSKKNNADDDDDVENDENEDHLLEKQYKKLTQKEEGGGENDNKRPFPFFERGHLVRREFVSWSNNNLEECEIADFHWGRDFSKRKNKNNNNNNNNSENDNNADIKKNSNTVPQHENIMAEDNDNHAWNAVSREVRSLGKQNVAKNGKMIIYAGCIYLESENEVLSAEMRAASSPDQTALKKLKLTSYYQGQKAAAIALAAKKRKAKQNSNNDKMINEDDDENNSNNNSPTSFLENSANFASSTFDFESQADFGGTSSTRRSMNFSPYASMEDNTTDVVVNESSPNCEDEKEQQQKSPNTTATGTMKTVLNFDVIQEEATKNMNNNNNNPNSNSAMGSPTKSTEEWNALGYSGSDSNYTADASSLQTPNFASIRTEAPNNSNNNNNNNNVAAEDEQHNNNNLSLKHQAEKEISKSLHETIPVIPRFYWLVATWVSKNNENENNENPLSVRSYLVPNFDHNPYPPSSSASKHQSTFAVEPAKNRGVDECRCSVSVIEQLAALRFDDRIRNADMKNHNTHNSPPFPLKMFSSNNNDNNANLSSFPELLSSSSSTSSGSSKTFEPIWKPQLQNFYYPRTHLVTINYTHFSTVFDLINKRPIFSCFHFNPLKKDFYPQFKVTSSSSSNSSLSPITNKKSKQFLEQEVKYSSSIPNCLQPTPTTCSNASCISSKNIQQQTTTTTSSIFSRSFVFPHESIRTVVANFVSWGDGDDDDDKNNNNNNNFSPNRKSEKIRKQEEQQQARTAFRGYDESLMMSNLFHEDFSSKFTSTNEIHHCIDGLIITVKQKAIKEQRNIVGYFGTKIEVENYNRTVCWFVFFFQPREKTNKEKLFEDTDEIKNNKLFQPETEIYLVHRRQGIAMSEPLESLNELSERIGVKFN